MGAGLMGLNNQIIFYLRREAKSGDMRVIARALEKTGDKYTKLLPDEPDLESAIRIFGAKKAISPFFRTKTFTYSISSSGDSLVISTSQGALDDSYNVLDFDGKVMPREDVEKMCLDNAKRFIEIGIVVWNALRETPYFGIGDCGYHLDAENDYNEAAKHANWLNFYGPELVRKYGGVKRMMKAPAHLVREIKDGVLIANGRSPFMPDSERAAAKKVVEYLGGGGK